MRTDIWVWSMYRSDWGQPTTVYIYIKVEVLRLPVVAVLAVLITLTGAKIPRLIFCDRSIIPA